MLEASLNVIIPSALIENLSVFEGYSRNFKCFIEPIDLVGVDHLLICKLVNQALVANRTGWCKALLGL